MVENTARDIKASSWIILVDKDIRGKVLDNKIALENVEGTIICYKCGGEGHTKRNCLKLNPTTCFLCGVEGHVKKDCPKLNTMNVL